MPALVARRGELQRASLSTLQPAPGSAQRKWRSLSRPQKPMPSLPNEALPSIGPHRVVIAGGGAGGLKLATRVGDTLGRESHVHFTLIERARSHFWKPHLHEIAAGSIDMHVHATDYLAQSHWHVFRYRVAEMVGLDRERRLLRVAPVLDDDGDPLTPPCARGYDTLLNQPNWWCGPPA